MDKEELILKLKALNKEIGDEEIAHKMADDLLCDFLELLGHKDVVDAFKEVDKWYA